MFYWEEIYLGENLFPLVPHTRVEPEYLLPTLGQTSITLLCAHQSTKTIFRGGNETFQLEEKTEDTSNLVGYPTDKDTRHIKSE